MANGGGHARLKRSLLLRDFLAHDLGLRLKDAERALEAAESSQGVADAFAGGAFLDAMAASVAGPTGKSVCTISIMPCAMHVESRSSCRVIRSIWRSC